jgi:hypothetical protein
MPRVTYRKFDCFPMCKFSQNFKILCLNLCATKFDPNLLASHLKFPIMQNHIKIISKLWFNCGLEFLGFYLEFKCLLFEFECHSNSN